MKFVTVRDLKNKTSEMLRAAANGKGVLITSHGRPVAMLQGFKEEDLEDWVFSHHPALRKSIEDAWREYQRKGGIPLAQVERELRRRLSQKMGKRRARVRP